MVVFINLLIVIMLCYEVGVQRYLYAVQCTAYDVQRRSYIVRIGILIALM